MRQGWHATTVALGLLLWAGPGALAQNEDAQNDDELVNRAQALRRQVKELEAAREKLRQRVAAEKQRTRAYSRAIYRALGRIRLIKRAERVTDEQLEKLESILRGGVREAGGKPPAKAPTARTDGGAEGPAKQASPTTAPAALGAAGWNPIGDTGFFHRDVTFSTEKDTTRVEGKIANRTSESYILVTMRFVALDKNGERMKAPVFYLALFERGETKRLPEIPLPREPADFRIELIGTERK